MHKIATRFLPIPHDTSLSSGEFAKITRVDAFIVAAAPAGNVTITLRNSGDAAGVTGVSDSHVFASTAFIVGEVYYMNIEKVDYANAGDQGTPPLIALL